MSLGEKEKSHLRFNLNFKVTTQNPSSPQPPPTEGEAGREVKIRDFIYPLMRGGHCEERSNRI